MKRCLLSFVSILILVSLCVPCFAISPSEQTTVETTVLDNGIVIVDTLTVFENARATTKTASKTREITSGTTLIAEITIKGTFSYNGTTSSVVSKSVTQTDTYDGWSYKQSSFTSSGGTITLNGKVTKLLTSQSFTLTLSCDKNGNIS